MPFPARASLVSRYSKLRERHLVAISGAEEPGQACTESFLGPGRVLGRDERVNIVKVQQQAGFAETMKLDT
jgi:hypothetical protein